MQTIRYDAYGGPDVLTLADASTPHVAKDEVLVRVHATSVNPADWRFMRGTPYVMRLGFGLGRPSTKVLGHDLAGTIEAVGADVDGFAVGDEVFAEIPCGTFAEYVSVPARRLCAKPARLAMEQAAAVPLAGVTALQAIRLGDVRPGSKVLINGASGGVGTFAVQIAKAIGAEVTAVCSGRNAERVRALGADRVIDYTQDDFCRGDARYDVVIDLVGVRAVSDHRRILAPKGTYVSAGGEAGGPWLGPIVRLLGLLLVSCFVSQKLRALFAEPRVEDLTHLAGLIETGKVTPIVDRIYPFEDLPHAMRYLETGRARGKVVVRI